jgi:putative restriction endonuclease
MSEEVLEEALQEEVQKEQAPFSLFDPTARQTETRQLKMARSIVFRNRVQAAYNRTCCVCAVTLRSPAGLREFEAAHIVPRSLSGSDDVRNGLGLCRRHHWAFDNGLFGVSGTYRVVVPNSVGALAENQALAAIGASPITLPANHAEYPDPAALAWHRANLLLA